MRRSWHRAPSSISKRRRARAPITGSWVTTISVVPADQEGNTVVAVLQKGYLIADRVLRPALVTVAGPKA